MLNFLVANRAGQQTAVAFIPLVLDLYYSSNFNSCANKPHRPHVASGCQLDNPNLYCIVVQILLSVNQVELLWICSDVARKHNLANSALWISDFYCKCWYSWTVRNVTHIIKIFFFFHSREFDLKKNTAGIFCINGCTCYFWPTAFRLLSLRVCNLKVSYFHTGKEELDESQCAWITLVGSTSRIVCKTTHAIDIETLLWMKACYLTPCEKCGFTDTPSTCYIKAWLTR